MADSKQDKTEKVATFQGEPVQLKYTLWALIQLEELYDIKLSDLQKSVDEETEMNFSQLIKIIHVGMLHKYPDVTFEELAQSFEIADIEPLGAEMARAMSASTAVGKPALSAGLA